MFALDGATAKSLARLKTGSLDALRRLLSSRWRLVKMASGTCVVARGDTQAWGRVTAFGWYELETELFLAHVLRPGAVVFDVGANEGVLTVVAAKHVGPAGRVIAFEPDRDAVATLERAVVKNVLDNVTVEPVAVGAESGTLALVQSEGTGYAKAMPTGPQVPCIALGDYCSVHGIERVDLVKIDADGPELDVLRGMGPLFARNEKPTWSSSCPPRHGDSAMTGARSFPSCETWATTRTRAG